MPVRIDAMNTTKCGIEASLITKETTAAVAPIAQLLVASMRVRQMSARPTIAR